MAGETGLEALHTRFAAAESAVNDAFGDGATHERTRISDWLKAKSLETEELLNKAADRADPDIQQERRRQAHQTRAIIGVLAIMVERNELVLAGRDGEP